MLSYLYYYNKCVRAEYRPACESCFFSPVRSVKRPVGVAPGYRDANSTRGYGAMRGVGSHGYSWSSFVSEDIAYRLGLSNGGISPQGIDNRAYGFPLRCLQE